MDGGVPRHGWAEARLRTIRDELLELLRDLEGARSSAAVVPRQRRGLVLIDGGLSLGGQHEAGRGERREYCEGLALIELW